MGIFDLDEVITEYSLKEALEDGALVEVFKNRWRQLSGGKPIVATMNVFEQVSKQELMEIWNGIWIGSNRCFPAVLGSGFSQRRSTA